jgi:hypothetical protein
MQLVAVAAWAILLPLHTLGVESLVLRREVIAVFAIAAGENDFVAGHDNLYANGLRLTADC